MANREFMHIVPKIQIAAGYLTIAFISAFFARLKAKSIN